MSERRELTKEEIETIVRLRTERKTWADIGTVIGLSRQTIADHAKKIGVWTKPIAHTKEVSDLPEDLLDKNRVPLPPGHPMTWDVIVKGTLLEGMKYPL